LQKKVSNFIVSQPAFAEKSWRNRGYLNLNFGTTARIKQMHFGQQQLHKHSEGEFSTVTLTRGWMNK